MIATVLLPCYRPPQGPMVSLSVSKWCTPRIAGIRSSHCPLPRPLGVPMEGLHRPPQKHPGAERASERASELDGSPMAPMVACSNHDEDVNRGVVRKVPAHRAHLPHIGRERSGPPGRTVPGDRRLVDPVRRRLPTPGLHHR